MHLCTVCVGLVKLIWAYVCGRGSSFALAMMQQLLEIEMSTKCAVGALFCTNISYIYILSSTLT